MQASTTVTVSYPSLQIIRATLLRCLEQCDRAKNPADAAEAHVCYQRARAAANRLGYRLCAFVNRSASRRLPVLDVVFVRIQPEGTSETLIETVDRCVAAVAGKR